MILELKIGEYLFKAQQTVFIKHNRLQQNCIPSNYEFSASIQLKVRSYRKLVNGLISKILFQILKKARLWSER